MPTLAEVRRQIEAYPHRYIFWTQKEIRALPEILDHDESIKAVTSGMVDGTTWLLVCTNRRVILLNSGMFYGVRQIQIPLDRIQSIDHSFTIVFGSISIWDGASSYRISMILKSSILPFVRTTEEAMYALRHGQNQRPMAAPTTDVASQISKLAELKEKGYLTDAEFQAQKRKLLES